MGHRHKIALLLPSVLLCYCHLLKQVSSYPYQLVLTTPDQHSSGLSPSQANEGKEILEGYYFEFIAGEIALKRPLAVEGKIQGQLRVENLEFRISGRYDRLDYLEDGLELIDYKSSKEVKLLNPAEIDLQIGLYYLALE